MNKRQAKKRLKKAIEIMKTSRKSGYVVLIKNHILTNMVENATQQIVSDGLSFSSDLKSKL